MARHLITTTATPNPCRHCGAWMLSGYAEGVLVHVDPIPLNEHEEFTALMDGRATYNLHAELTGRQYLAQRTVSEIAAPRRCVVVTTHRCGRPIGTLPAPPPAPPPPPADSDHIPF